MTITAGRDVGRVVWVDRLRGLAVVAMVVDHVCAVLAYVWHVPGPWVVLRLTVGRVAFPVFLLLTGWLLVGRGPSSRRTARIAAAGVGAALWSMVCGLPIGQPDILLLIAAVLAVWPVIVRAPVLAAAVGVIQPFTWPVPWAGYQPGALVALMVLGWLWGQPGPDWQTLRLVDSDLGWVPEPVRWLGRWPLEFYVGHLVVLGVVVVVVGGLA